MARPNVRLPPKLTFGCRGKDQVSAGRRRRELLVRPADRRVVAVLAGIIPAHPVIGEGAAAAAYRSGALVETRHGHTTLQLQFSK